jgi:hypothetical protein
VCERLAGEHELVRLLRHPNGENRGAGESRNAGLRATRYELVAFLDADDYMLPGRFRRAVEIMSGDETMDGVYEPVGNHCETEEAAHWWQKHRGGSTLTRVVSLVEPERLLRMLLSGQVGCFHTNGITVRRRLFDRTGLFKRELRMCQDTNMWYRMAAVGRLTAGRLNEAVAMRRIHGENRIINDRQAHADYALRSARDFFRWACRQQLGHEEMMGATNLLVTQQEQAFSDWGPVVRWPIHLWALLRILVLFPAAWRSWRYRMMASHLFPAYRLIPNRLRQPLDAHGEGELNAR